MSSPNELNFDEILKFMLAHNGKVTNHELVKHFKVFLTNPDMRDEARSTFKKHVNALANIKNHNNEKWLILKKKYLPSNGKESDVLCESRQPESPRVGLPDTSYEEDTGVSEPLPPRPPPPVQLNENLNLANIMLQEQQPIAMAQYNNKGNDSIESPQYEDVPIVQPRRKSSVDKSSLDKRSSQPSSTGSAPQHWTPDVSQGKETLPITKSEAMLVDSEHTISVKERKQMFNRMASEGDIIKQPIGNQNNLQGQDEEDRASVISLDHKNEADPLDPKQKAWILCAARGEYHALAKMCSENSKLAKTKDPFTTAMHWACKRGDENLVKMLAGVARSLANARSGYTPLHIAMQFRHENVYRLLVDVYDADASLRDWAGKRALQYLVHMDTSFHPGSYRKKEGFLRIGSLNVRVKKTTEAFSNFLGVGATRSSSYVPKTARLDERRDDAAASDQLHKNWGSADNIQKDEKLMPPPLSSKVRRRGAAGRKGAGAHSRSTPSTPDQPRAQIGTNEEGGDSDSDSAAGFHSAWRQQRASDVM